MTHGTEKGFHVFTGTCPPPFEVERGGGGCREGGRDTAGLTGVPVGPAVQDGAGTPQACLSLAPPLRCVILRTCPEASAP